MVEIVTSVGQDEETCDHSGAGIGLLFIGQACQVIHAGVQCQRDALALFKGVIALAGFDLGLVALVNAGEHLHLHLCIPLCLAKLFQPCHVHHPGNYGILTY